MAAPALAPVLRGSSLAVTRQRRVGLGGTSGDGGGHLLVGGKAALAFFGEAQGAVHRDLEHAAGGLAQFDPRVGGVAEDDVSRLAGARFVVSGSAVFDLDIHGGSFVVAVRIWVGGVAGARRYSGPAGG